MPNIPEMAPVWTEMGLAEYKVATGADPATTLKTGGRTRSTRRTRNIG